MKRIIQLLTLLLFATSGTTDDRNIPVYLDPEPGVFFRDWLLCGPFPNPLPVGIHEYRFDSTSLGHYRDYLTQYGGEGSIHLKIPWVPKSLTAILLPLI